MRGKLIRDKIDIDDLCFMITVHKLSFSSQRERESLETYNIFQISGVKWAVAKYVTMSGEEKRKRDNPLFYCFCDVWSRCEYEMILCPWPCNKGDTVEEKGQKIDAYELFVKPNEDLLMDMINSVTVSSAKRYLRDHGYRGRQK